MRRLAYTGVMMLLAFATANQAQAQVKTLIMPGPVVEGHADLEPDCDNCHQAFKRPLQRGLCADCHTEVAQDIAAAAGFHGRSPDVGDSACANCHTEHEGRDADIVGLNESTFDHTLTDFNLLDAHADAACDSCHASENKFRDAPSSCIDCHREENVHGGTMSESCGDCHTATDWAAAEFDHSVTGYGLIGEHLEPGCLDCHEDQTFVGAPEECVGCHADDDVHNGRSGNECENCHSPKGWLDTSFDHDRDTDFMLLGMHAELTCDGCHSSDPFADERESECIACHLEDDSHDGRFGDTCETCHGNDEWTAIHFDHDIDTHHALDGAHELIECTACHIQPIFEVALESDCLACHEPDDAHEGSLGIACNDCHNETTWQDDVFFDHGLTRFPLLGAHGDTTCEDCHQTHVFTDAPSDCVACHEEDDKHAGRFGGECAQCHNPVDWHQWKFDHSAQTDFELEGAHIDVACESCHRQPLDIQANLGRRCTECHRSDDIHNGEFGHDCERCHSVDSFSEVEAIP